MRLPSLVALQMLEASARLESFTRAAEELSVTESAVCRQVLALEKRFGITFFDRVKKRLVLTPEGDHYVRGIREQLRGIESATNEMASRAGGREVLEIAVVPTFATQWLIPRLSSLAQAQPRLLVNISSRTDPFHFQASGFDAAIYSGTELWPGTTGKLLTEEGPCIAVCSPALLDKRSIKLKESKDLLQFPLLHLKSRTDAWANLLGDVDDELRLRANIGVRYDLFTMLIRAAQEGQGMALIPKMLVKDELERGSLTSPLKDEGDAYIKGRGYFLTHRSDKPALEKLEGFLYWLDKELVSS